MYAVPRNWHVSIKAVKIGVATQAHSVASIVAGFIIASMKVAQILWLEEVYV